MLQQPGEHLHFPAELLVAALHGLLGLVDAPLHHLDVRHDQLQVDDVNVPDGVGGAFHMGDVTVVKAAHHMDDGVGGADVGQELVAKTLAFGGTLHQSCNVHEFNDGRGGFLGLMEVAEPVQALIRNGHYAHIGVDGAEGVVICRYTGVGNGIKKGRLAHIGQTDNS